MCGRRRGLLRRAKNSREAARSALCAAQHAGAKRQQSTGLTDRPGSIHAQREARECPVFLERDQTAPARRKPPAAESNGLDRPISGPNPALRDACRRRVSWRRCRAAPTTPKAPAIPVTSGTAGGPTPDLRTSVTKRDCCDPGARRRWWASFAPQANVRGNLETTAGRGRTMTTRPDAASRWLSG